MSGLEDLTIVVTGGASNIGRAIAERVAAGGAHAVIVDVADGSEAVAAIETAGGSAEYREGDVTDEASMAAAFEGLSVDVLVNNAAIYSPLIGTKTRFDGLDRDDWESVMNVNATGVFLASKHALPHLTEGGAIVNMASDVATVGIPGFLHYVASKAAVIGMTRAMANELGDLSIRVNAVLPGLTRTENVQTYDDDYLEEIVDRQAIGRPLYPEDIAGVVAMLCRPESWPITGQVINADVGLHHY
jgi:NAD(P)-dependent dehydrogenase (short-subunit alcohol dehydrogenase family)